MNRSRLVVFAIGALVVCATASAQTSRVQLGPMLGYEFGAPLGLDRTRGAINDRFTFDGNGQSRRHIGWAGLSLGLPDLMSNSLGIAGRISLGAASGWFQSLPYTGDPLVDSLGIIITPQRRFTISSTELLLGIDLRGQWRMTL